jgi:hypothetical protein
MKHDDIAEDKKLIKKAFAMHDKQEHKGGKGTNLSKLKKGGAAKAATMTYETYTKTGKPAGLKTVKMKAGGPTGMDMRAHGRNMARAMNQKSGRGG